MKTFAIDTETYYDDDCSVTKLGAEAYTRHPRYYCGMVSVVGPGVRFVGKPQDVPWSKIQGATWVAHNAQFDRWVINRMRESGEIPADAIPLKWLDTTAIPAYLQVGRSLDVAAKVLLGRTPDKTVRAKMKGKHFKDLNKTDWEILCQYALTDSDLCLELYNKFHKQIPSEEWELAALTIDQGDRGVQIDRQLLETFIGEVQCHQKLALDEVPWRADKPATSVAALRTQLATDGVLGMPKSTDANDPEWIAFVERVDKPYVKAFTDLRRISKHLATLQTIENRIDADGILHFSMKYCGSRLTGRWAGDSGLNMQNLTKGELFGASVRDLFTPRRGHKFVIADMSNIEPRCAAAIAGDTEFLELVGKGMDIYEAYARKALGYNDPRPLKEVDNDLRQRSKIAVPWFRLWYVACPVP
jgi:DNA polymerase I-like protein with 3'-5' exonuclease and polymerase domains